MGRPLTGPEVLEARMGDFLEDWFGGTGVPCQPQPVPPGRDNLLARFESPGPRGRSSSTSIRTPSRPTA